MAFSTGAGFRADGLFRDSCGRIWPLTTIAAVRADREFYLTRARHDPFGRQMGFIELLLDLASCYEQMGWTDSAASTRGNARDLQMVLGVA
jgi:hypothetical protein